MIKILDVNIGENLCNFRIGKDFLEYKIMNDKEKMIIYTLS